MLVDSVAVPEGVRLRGCDACGGRDRRVVLAIEPGKGERLVKVVLDVACIVSMFEQSTGYSLRSQLVSWDTLSQHAAGYAARSHMSRRAMRRADANANARDTRRGQSLRDNRKR